jgi:hypothetical protein
MAQQRRRTATPAETATFIIALAPEMGSQPHPSIRRDEITSLHWLLVVGYPDGGINSYGRAVEGACLMDKSCLTPPDISGYPSAAEKMNCRSGFAWSGSTD